MIFKPKSVSYTSIAQLVRWHMQSERKVRSLALHMPTYQLRLLKKGNQSLLQRRHPSAVCGRRLGLQVELINFCWMFTRAYPCQCLKKFVPRTSSLAWVGTNAAMDNHMASRYKVTWRFSFFLLVKRPERWSLGDKETAMVGGWNVDENLINVQLTYIAWDFVF